MLVLIYWQLKYIILFEIHGNVQSIILSCPSPRKYWHIDCSFHGKFYGATTQLQIFPFM